MKKKKLLAILLTAIMSVAALAFSGCFDVEPNSSSDSSSSSSSSSEREPWYDQNVDPDGWT